MSSSFEDRDTLLVVLCHFSDIRFQTRYGLYVFCLRHLFTAQLSTKSRTTFTESMMTVAEGDEEEDSDSDSDSDDNG